MDAAFQRTLINPDAMSDDTASSLPTRTSRRIPFQALATRLHVPIEHLEPILVRALSRDLIRGKIDQVDQVLDVTWVKPRYLDASQVRVLRERLRVWEERVRRVSDALKQGGDGGVGKLEEVNPRDAVKAQ